MNFIHISHNDLDGYGCQYITSFLFDNIEYYNIDYKDINDVIENLKNVHTDTNIIITDLSFNKQQFKLLLEKFYKNKVLFIDHHKSTRKAFEEFLYENNFQLPANWNIIINTKYSATKRTYYYYILQNQKLKEEYFKINLIDIYDLWKTEEELFNKSIFYSNLIFMNFPLFETEKRKLNFFLIKKIGKLLEKNNVRNIEKDLNNIIYQFLKQEFQTEIEHLRKEIKDIDNLDIKTFTAMLQFKKILENSEKITKEIYLIENLHPDILQYGTLLLFKQNKKLVLLNLTRKENFYKISIRSNNKNAIKIAELLGGGGHNNAAGAIFKGSKEEIIKKLKNY